MPLNVLLGWEANNISGWGILGLNLLFQWAARGEIAPFMARRIRDESLLFVDPFRLSIVNKAIGASNDFADMLAKERSPIDFDGTVIQALSHSDSPIPIHAKRQIGRYIFENADISSFEFGNFDALLCGSNWNAEIIRKETGLSVDVIFEGIDPSIFCPGSRSGLFDPARFYIFSGGKVELRKGQDLVLRAFREFSKRHSDAVLVTAWHSPWPNISAGFKGTLDAPLVLDERGFVNVRKWVADNGVDPSRVVEVFCTPNELMPTLLREMHVALQASRAEPCTNLPAMEAMACGVPVIIADNTGVKDLITEDNCVRLSRQDVVTLESGSYCTVGWGESSVDEIVEALEMLYADRKWGRLDGFANIERGRSMRTSSRTWCYLCAEWNDKWQN